jgi:hypothetical protein
VPVSQTFVSMVIGRLRSDDIYNQVRIGQHTGRNGAGMYRDDSPDSFLCVKVLSCFECFMSDHAIS